MGHSSPHSRLRTLLSAIQALDVPGFEEFTWQAEAEAISHQPEPEHEVELGRDALVPCDLLHCIGGVARMNEEHGGPGMWMVLRNMSTGTDLVGRLTSTYTQANTAHDPDALEFLSVLGWDHIPVDLIYAQWFGMACLPEGEV